MSRRSRVAPGAPGVRVVGMDDGHLVGMEPDDMDVESRVLHRWREPGD